jgi:AraC-like DNA-binding protein
VNVIHNQVQATNVSVFETLQTAITDFMNNRAWTELQYQQEERIDCTMNITVKQYKQEENSFQCELLFQLNRPVYNSSYNTIVFSKRDQSFNFNYKEYDPMEFNINMMDNQLTALLAYYAYLFIGMDLDTFSPLGGTDVLNQAMMIVNNAQSMTDVGWKAFDDPRNRHGIINDYLESSMEPFRQLQYKYHRLGLDEMSNNADRGRTAITEAIDRWKANAHYREHNLTLGIVARQMGVPQRQLQEWLRQSEYGKLAGLVTTLRIEEAKRVLKEHPDWSNDTIAQRCGFSDRTTLQRTFKEKTGMTPTQFIQENQ